MQSRPKQYALSPEKEPWKWGENNRNIASGDYTVTPLETKRAHPISSDLFNPNHLKKTIPVKIKLDPNHLNPITNTQTYSSKSQ